MGRFTAHDLLPREGGDIELVPRQILRKGRRGCIANGQARAIGRDHVAIGHLYTRGRAVPCEHNIRVIIDRAHVNDLAIIGVQNSRIEFQLFDNITDPTCTEAFPSDHCAGARTQERPHGHLNRACVRSGHDANAIVSRHAQNFTSLVNRGGKLCLANRSTVRPTQRGVSQFIQCPDGGFGAGARRKTRISRPRCRSGQSHDVIPSQIYAPRWGGVSHPRCYTYVARRASRKINQKSRS